MPLFAVIWDLPDDPNGNIQHIAEHGLTPIDVEYVLNNPERHATSDATGWPIVFGHTAEGEYVVVVYEDLADGAVYPITAYAVEE